MNHRNLGRAFKTLRLMRKMHQQDIAEATGLSESFIGKVENGMRDPSWSTMVSFADALGVNVALVVALSEQEDPQVAPMMPLVYNQVLREREPA
jgi:transcriptional regulator with XRE-family HTH domain